MPKRKGSNGLWQSSHNNTPRNVWYLPGIQTLHTLTHLPRYSAPSPSHLLRPSIDIGRGYSHDFLIYAKAWAYRIIHVGGSFRLGWGAQHHRD